MRSMLLALCLVLAGCCGGPGLDQLIATELGAREKDLIQWDQTSDATKKQQAEASLEFVKEVKFRLGE